MKEIRILFFVSLFSLLAACSSGGSGQSAHQDTNSSHVSVNGQSPQEYYGQFVQKVHGDCKTQIIYTDYIKSEVFKLAPAEDGRDVLGSLSVFMNRDGTFKADYEEQKVRSYTANGYGYDVINKQEPSGHWSIDSNEQLVLEGLGQGKAMTYNGSPGVYFQFVKNLGAEGMAGQKVFISMASSDSTVEEIMEFCGKK